MTDVVARPQGVQTRVESPHRHDPTLVALLDQAVFDSAAGSSPFPLGSTRHESRPIVRHARFR